MLFAWWHSPELSDPHWLWLGLLLPLVWIVSGRSLVDRPKRQLVASAVIRTAIAALIILAICRATVMQSGRQVFAVFAVDESLSVDSKAGSARAAEFINKATARVAEDRWKVVRFASTPTAPDDDTSRGKWQLGSNPEAALRIAQATVPAAVSYTHLRAHET